jgi:hypothetical protein
MKKRARAGVGRHHGVASAKFRSRITQRSRLSDTGSAWSSRQPAVSSWMNSIIRVVYRGPTERPLPCRGIRSSRTARRRDCRARLISSRFGSSRQSGFFGSLATLTPKSWAKRSRSASNHASIARTATRKHIRADGLASHLWAQGGAQSQSRSKSTRTTQGVSRAALLYPLMDCSRNRFPFLP